MWHCYCCTLAGLDRHQRRDCCCCEQRLPWCWAEKAAPWISQQLGLLVFHIVGTVLVIALCLCWQCLLTVGGNCMPHIITPLDVIIMVLCSRQTQDVLHPAECLPGTLKMSEWQWRASVFIRWHCTGSSSSPFTDDFCLHRNLTLWFPCWLNISDKQACQLVISITLNIVKFLPLRVAYHRVFDWMWLFYFTY